MSPWPYRAFLALWGAFLLLFAIQASKSGKAVQTVDVWPDSVVDGSEAYFPARDTSFLRYLCCGVIR